MAHYMLIGIERSKRTSLRRGTDVSNIPRHLLEATPYNWNGKTEYSYYRYSQDRYRDKVSIADIDNISQNRVKVITIPSDKLKDFEQQYGLEGISGNLSKYGSTNIEGYQPMIIINKIGDIGCQCVDVHGNIVNLRNADILRYANNYGIANAKVYEKVGYKNNTLIISGINWTIPTVTPEQAMNTAKKVDKPSKAPGKLENYAAKAALLGSDQFEIDGQTATLIKCKFGKYGRLVLPPVQVIGWDSFHDIQAEEIVIPETVRSIGARAFKGANITTLTILGDVETIADEAFGFERLNYVNIGERVKNPRVLKELQHYTLKEVTVSPNNKYFKSVDGIVYTKDMKELIIYPAGHEQEEYIMPNTIEGTLHKNSLNSIRNLKRVRISDKIKKMEPYAINICPRLEQIELGQWLEQVDNRAIACKEHATKQIIVNSPIELRMNKEYIVPNRDSYDVKYNGGKELLDSVNAIRVVYRGKAPDSIAKSIQEADALIDEYCKRQEWI